MQRVLRTCSRKQKGLQGMRLSPHRAFNVVDIYFRKGLVIVLCGPHMDGGNGGNCSTSTGTEIGTVTVAGSGLWTEDWGLGTGDLISVS